MSDFILMTGDMAMFLPMFDDAIVAVRPGILNGSGKPTIMGSKVCLEGDEKEVMVPGCSYMTPVYSIPGVGTLMIESLAPDQTTKKLIIGGKAALLKGSQFEAKFMIMVPAMEPSQPVPIPDSTPEYSGQGQFITRNIKWRSC